MANGEGTMNYASGDVYKGDWLDGKRSGEGHMEYANGDVYEGGWLDDQRSGEGVLSAGDGIRVYTGEWVEDEMEGPVVLTLSFNQEQGWVSTLEATYENGKLVGEGVYTPVNGGAITATWEYVESMTMADGALYTGLLVDGLPYGYGSILYEDETSYTGEFSEGKRSGVGFMDEGEDYYIGEWKNDVRNGYGYRHYFDGSVFEGSWIDDMPGGQGSYTYVNGDVVEGTWSYTMGETIRILDTDNYYVNGDYLGLMMDGVPCGFGIALIEILDEDHTVLFSGEWKDGHPYGDGTFVTDSGDTLTGDWSYEEDGENSVFILDGMANGLGLWEYNNGTYFGEFRNDLSEGYGYMIFEEGDSYTGYWQNNALHGYGVYKWADGDIYDGEYENGSKSGYGTYYWPHGDWFEGEWADDQQNGQGTYHWADGSSRVGTWQNGELVSWM